MEYTELKDEQRVSILRGRLAMLEEHHYKLMLDIADAESVNDAATLELAHARQTTLEQQISNTRASLSGLNRTKG